MRKAKNRIIPVIMYVDVLQEQDGRETLQSLIAHTPDVEWNICLFGDKNVCKKICYVMQKKGIRADYEKSFGGLRRLLGRYPQAISLRPGLETVCDLLPLLDTLWEDRKSGWSIAAVPLMRNYVAMRYLQQRGFDEQQGYYNTGFMVIHSKNFLRGLNELEKCCRKFQGIYSLEDCLNLMYQGHFKELELSWNYPTAPGQADARNLFLILADMQQYQACSIQWIIDRRGYHSPLASRKRVRNSDSRKYKFSIIVPVRKEDYGYVEGLMDSLRKQTLDFDQAVQLILIDGGNGVLQARNAGIRLARGKIFLFLDVRDRLSERCLELIDNLMERCPQMQIACIPVCDDRGNRNKKNLLPVSEQGWLDLECDYGLGFDGVSGVFFRRSGRTGKFDESQPLWEAEWQYLVKRLNKYRRIGYVPEAQLQSGKRVSNLDDLAYFQKYYGSFWTRELDQWGAEQKSIPYWMQFSFMQSLALCFDSAEAGRDNEQLWEIFSVPLSRIEDSVVIDSLGMQDMSRILHVLEHKYHSSTDVIPRLEDAQLVCGQTIVGMLSYQSVVLHFITIQDGVLTIEGETALPTAVGREHIHMGLDINGNLFEGEFIGRNADRRLLGCVYEYDRTFRFIYKLPEKEVIIRFYTLIEERRVYYGNITCMRFAPVSNEVPEGYAVRDGRILKVRGDKLFCTPADIDAINRQENRYRQVLNNMKFPEACLAVRLRRYYKYFQARKQRQVWLFFDRIDKADDNGEALFRYVVSRKNPNINAYYIIDKGAEDYERIRAIGRVVAANSVSHQLLHLLADYIFTSQANGFVENPFGKGERFYRDLYHRPKVIFLQHGITKDDQTRQFNRFNQNFYALITSSTSETDSIKRYPYYYEDASIWQTGMPRFDRLYHDERRYLLIMPTWRRQLMEQRWDPELKVFRWRAKAGFEESLYCRSYSSLLCHRELRESCRRYGYQMVFMPHPLVQPYMDRFAIPEDVLVMPYDTSWRDLFAWCNLMITDYSSVAFDLAYLKKPLIYYQFDREEFFAGHTYVEGYFDYQTDGFGEIAIREEDLIDLIEKYMAEGCCLKEKYRERIYRFYGNLDQNCCERVYRRVFEQQNAADHGYGNVGKQ